MEKYETVNSPSHYKSGNVEVIDIIEAMGYGPGFCAGNFIKYMLRAGKKPGSDELEDFRKAQWYLKRFIQKEQEKQCPATTSRPSTTSNAEDGSPPPRTRATKASKAKARRTKKRDPI